MARLGMTKVAASAVISGCAVSHGNQREIGWYEEASSASYSVGRMPRFWGLRPFWACTVQCGEAGDQAMQGGVAGFWRAVFFTQVSISGRQLFLSAPMVGPGPDDSLNYSLYQCLLNTSTRRSWLILVRRSEAAWGTGFFRHPSNLLEDTWLITSPIRNWVRSSRN